MKKSLPPLPSPDQLAYSARCIFVKAINRVLDFPDAIRALTVTSARTVLPAGARAWGNRRLTNPGDKARRYLAPGITVQTLFTTLAKRKVNYVVLRWFEDLPDIAEGEDIDLLIADECMHKVADLFCADERRQKCDVYSVSGLRGSNYLGMPYYPPVLARQILDNRITSNSGISVPDRELHFLSLAYHLLFHKGRLSTDHDYMATLRAIAPVDADPNLDSFDALYAYLAASQWTPELDSQRKLAVRSPWLAEKLGMKSASVPRLQSRPEILVFIVRDWGATPARMRRIVQRLRAVPLEVLHQWPLDAPARENAINAIRGGNWGPGVYKTGGGKPHTMIVCFDYHPQLPNAEQLEEFPFLGNAHYLVKHQIRDQLNECELRFHQANSIHSADDEVEALHYLAAAFPQRVGEVRSQADARAPYFDQPYPVLALLQTHRTRAKVEQIEFEGKPALKKTFKYGNERFLARELLVHGELAPLHPAIPPLLGSGSNYLIIPWYDNLLSDTSVDQRKAMLHPHAADIVNILEFFYTRGFALIDFHPGNLILSESEGLRVVDFEFLHQYREKPANFCEAYDIVGIPPDFEGDLPSGHKGSGRTYINTWLPILGKLEAAIGSRGIPA